MTSCRTSTDNTPGKRSAFQTIKIFAKFLTIRLEIFAAILVRFLYAITVSQDLTERLDTLGEIWHAGDRIKDSIDCHFDRAELLFSFVRESHHDGFFSLARDLHLLDDAIAKFLMMDVRTRGEHLMKIGLGLPALLFHPFRFSVFCYESSNVNLRRFFLALFRWTRLGMDAIEKAVRLAAINEVYRQDMMLGTSWSHIR